MNVSRSRFLPNTAALGIATAATTLLTLGQVKILARALPQDDFGLFAALRGLSLLVAMLAANGLPQLLVRYLPGHESRGELRKAYRLSAICVLAVGVLLVLLITATQWLKPDILDQMSGRFLFWFYAATIGVSLKLVIYGGLNGIRRLSAQTTLEVVSLAAQVVWLFAVRDNLNMTQLFKILGTVSLATVAVGLPLYFLQMSKDVNARSDAQRADQPVNYTAYWLGATGLSIVALAFSDVDRYLLSRVMTLELLSLFHIGSRVVRLANRFMSVPVLAFQPEVTRLDSEGRGAEVELSTLVFIKFNVVVATFIAACAIVYAPEIIRVVSSAEYLPAAPLLTILAISVPMTAVTAPLTTVMKARDHVRRALYCDLAWALVYVFGITVLARSYGIIGAGVAQLTACVAQLALASVLGNVQLSAILIPALRVVLSAVGALIPAIVVGALMSEQGRLGLLWKLLMLLPAPLIYRALVRRFNPLDGRERERLAAMFSAGGMSVVVRRLL